MGLDKTLKKQIGSFFERFGINQAKMDVIIDQLKFQGTKLLGDLQQKYTSPDSKVNPQDCSKYNNQIKNNESKIDQVKNILNSINTIIDKFKLILETINTILKIISTIIQIISSLPVPSSTPPGIGIPLGIIMKLSQLIQKNREILDRCVELIEQATNGITKIIIPTLNKIESGIKIADTIIGQIKGFLSSKGATCIDNSNKTETIINRPEEINNIIGEYNGFTFLLQTEENPKFQIGNIKRHYAIANNSHGQTILKGTPSFSSNTQILIDELIFQINKTGIKS